MSTTFAPQPNGGAHGINAYGPGYVEVNGVRHESPFVLHPDTGTTPLPSHICAQTITAQELQLVASRQPEVVLIGTGSRQIFLPAAVLAPLMAKRIGVECMSSAAACRTFNLLAAEGRKAIAVMLFDGPSMNTDHTSPSGFSTTA